VRDIHVAVRATTSRKTATATGSTLATTVANYVAIDVVCLVNLPAYVFTRPTSVATGIAFVATRSTLAKAGPTQVATTLVLISIGETLARTRSGSSPAAASLRF